MRWAGHVVRIFPNSVFICTIKGECVPEEHYLVRCGGDTLFFISYKLHFSCQLNCKPHCLDNKEESFWKAKKRSTGLWQTGFCGH
jgi:hypothetical protein